MEKTPTQIKAILDRILPYVQRPGRYTGGELNQIKKDWDQIKTKLCLVFPDIYDLGMSNYGLAIFYDILNKRTDTLAERAYSPWTDMEEQMRKVGLPLYSLESKTSLDQFDIIGITLPYETLFTNALNILDLGNIPIFSSERDESHPLVIAGGHGMLNPEPMHAFLDAVVIGEGEEVINEIVDTYQNWKSSAGSRSQLLDDLAAIPGVYVPSLYSSEYKTDGTISKIIPLSDKASYPITKRIVSKLPAPVTDLIVPYIDTVHNRIPIEIMRGCTRGCRFCQAGFVTRPVRERSVDEIINAIEVAVSKTGFEEVGLLSLSSSDYSHALELVKAVGEKFGNSSLSVSLPSLRIESFSVELMDSLKDTRRSGFTLAPEAATERMRKIINKPVDTEQLLQTAKEIYSRGWTNIKLYFMIGHPEETLEDVQAIADLCKAVLKEGNKAIGRKSKLTVGVSTFIPKPHTPFQWASCDSPEQIIAKQNLLRKELRAPGIKLNWSALNETLFEVAISRGDRRLSDVIYKAWKNGAKFDAWHEHFNWDHWLDAFEQAGLDPDFYTLRERSPGEILPWNHISTAVKPEYLLKEYKKASEGETTADCRDQCYACGILPEFNYLRRENPGDHWKCPEVAPKKKKVVAE
jgi:radical SAM family uncharacterized protein